MADQAFPHLFLREVAPPREFTSPQSFSSKPKFPDRDRATHGAKLAAQIADLWEADRGSARERNAVALPTRSGVYVEFRGAAGFDLMTKSLEYRPAGIRLLSVKKESDPTNPGKEITRATVFIPPNKEGFF